MTGFWRWKLHFTDAERGSVKSRLPIELFNLHNVLILRVKKTWLFIFLHYLFLILKPSYRLYSELSWFTVLKVYCSIILMTMHSAYFPLSFLKTILCELLMRLPMDLRITFSVFLGGCKILAIHSIKDFRMMTLEDA